MSLPTRESQRAVHMTLVAKLESKPEFQILSALIEQSDHSPVAAVQQILELTTESRDSKTLDTHLYDTACSVIELGKRTAPEQQTRLVTFVNELQKTTIIDPSTGEPQVHSHDIVWTDLPTFGYAFLDDLQATDARDTSNTVEERREMENLNALAAQLTATSVVLQTNFSYWVPMVLWIAWPHSPSDASQLHAVRVACLWYIYAADKLWARVCDEEKEDFKREDWDRYKQCLLESQAKIRNQATRKLIEEALAELRRVENK